MTSPCRLLLAVLGTAALAACAPTQPSRFYVLTPIAAATALSPTATRNGPAVTVGPVELPKHLDRSEIVTFASRSRVDLAEFDRWAEPLSDNIARVVAANLSVLVPTDNISLFSSRRALPYDFQVVVDVLTLQVTPERSVSLVAAWTVFAQDGRKLLSSAKSEFSEAATAAGVEAVVEAINRTVASLSGEIASAVRGMLRVR